MTRNKARRGHVDYIDFAFIPQPPMLVALGNKKWIVDLAQGSGMILSYFFCVRGVSYEHASENHHAD